MTTPNYRYAVNWIAQMDEAGNAEASTSDMSPNS